MAETFIIYSLVYTLVILFALKSTLLAWEEILNRRGLGLLDFLNATIQPRLNVTMFLPIFDAPPDIYSGEKSVYYYLSQDLNFILYKMLCMVLIYTGFSRKASTYISRRLFCLYKFTT